MSNRFVADPRELQKAGDMLHEQADQFNKLYNKIFTTVNNLINSDYVAPSAKVFGRVVGGFKPNLVAMENAIRDYGNYCTNAGNTVIRADEAIADSIGSSNF